jgi:predicted AAA+ superfamily ATPase
MYIPRLADEIATKNILEPKKILMIIGARQVGKTTLVKKILENKNYAYLNFDIAIDKERFLASSALSPQDARNYLGSPDYLVVDEAQREPKTGAIVKGWYDSGLPIKIILLGSSSFDLLNRFSESLTGRNEKIFLSPLLFEEIIRNQPWFSQKLPKETAIASFKEQIKTLLMQSLVFGNYPEVAATNEKEKLLANLTADYLFKDVLQLGLVKSPEQISRLLSLLAHQIGSEVSINELANNLAISRQTVEKYLDILEQTFVIFRLRAFATNPRKEIAKSQKIYFYDTGIRNALLKEFSANELRPDIGALWENWVIAEFTKKNLLEGNLSNLHFWRSRTQSEVDLVIKRGEAILAYEIKWKKTGNTSKSFTEQYRIPVNSITSANPLFF